MINLIQADIDALAAKLLDKGFTDPAAELVVKTTDSYAPMRLELSYKVRPDSVTSYVSVRHYNLRDELGRDPSYSDYLAEARRLIDEMPSQRDQALKEFVNRMELLRADAEELGIDEDFVNPFIAIMNKLASNALPAPK